jgi:indole-3-glycerol phosphate synthase
MSFLEQILTSRRSAVDVLIGREGQLLEAIATGPPVRDFRGALKADGVSLIAEIKRRSPSKGDLNPTLDPGVMAKAYERGGARAISVLCEPEFFAGSPGDLVAARSSVELPVLWKDFVLDEVQLLEARACGADAVLLIVRMLGAELPSLVASANDLGLCPLVEVFNEDDLERALEAGADVIGVNHRDLETFEEDPSATKRLRSLVPNEVVLVAESAIKTPGDIRGLHEIGVHAALVGEAFVTADDPESKVRELAEA